MKSPDTPKNTTPPKRRVKVVRKAKITKDSWLVMTRHKQHWNLRMVPARYMYFLDPEYDAIPPSAQMIKRTRSYDEAMTYYTRCLLKGEFV